VKNSKKLINKRDVSFASLIRQRKHDTKLKIDDINQNTIERTRKELVERVKCGRLPRTNVRAL
jgi:hypothetical protein